MLAYPFEERRLTNTKFGWKWPIHVQPKLDGVRCWVDWPDLFPVPTLLSSTGLPIELDHISDELMINAKKLGVKHNWDGEIYRHGWPFESVYSAVENANNGQRHELQYWIFDIKLPIPQDMRTEVLKLADGIYANPESKLVYVIPVKVNNMDELMNLYNKWVNPEVGFEGIIVRSADLVYVDKRSTKMLKFKPKKFDIFTITGVEEAISKTGVPLGMIGALYIDGTNVKIGAGQLTHQERRYFFEHKSEIINRGVLTQYQSLTVNGRPRFGLATKILDFGVQEEREELC